MFLDRSVLEVYCGGVALTDRTFSDPRALGLDLFAEGGDAWLTSLDIWKMSSMWEDGALAAQPATKRPARNRSISLREKCFIIGPPFSS